MRKIFYAAIFATGAPTVVCAAGATPTSWIPGPDWIVFALALAATAWLSLQAFDRPVLDLGGVPTFPRYMTRRGPFLGAKVLFVALCLLIYALLVTYHKDLPELVTIVDPALAGTLKTLINQKDPSYLVIIVVASVCFVGLLRIEGKWNFLLIFRDIVYSWVSIPYLAKRITGLVNNGITVPNSFTDALPDETDDWHIGKADFGKNRNSMDRRWAELCYLQWWISERHREDPESTFFAETSFGWDEVNSDFGALRLAVVALKKGLANGDDDAPKIMEKITACRGKVGRLIACYLIFMNSTREGLFHDASQLGIRLDPGPLDNPLRYSAIYAVALIVSVCVGVYLSAAVYDLIDGIPVRYAFLAQNFQDVQTWVFLAFGDYGAPILGILILRYVLWLGHPVRSHTSLITYAWIFLLAEVLSILGLSFMVECFGSSATNSLGFLALCQREAIWSFGPALICLYINHYMDRQIDHTRLDIGQGTRSSVLWRAGYAVLFTLLVMVTALPFLPTIHAAEHAAWPLLKLQFVSMGTIFWVTLVLALVAQFALMKPRQVPTPEGGRPVQPVPVGDPDGHVSVV